MKDDLRDKLNKYGESKGWGSDDGAIAEILTGGKTLKREDYDKHRWYTTFTRVVDIDGLIVAFADYENSGDEPAFDAEDYREMVLDSAVEVIAVDTTVTAYKVK